MAKKVKKGAGKSFSGKLKRAAKAKHSGGSAAVWLLSLAALILFSFIALTVIVATENSTLNSAGIKVPQWWQDLSKSFGRVGEPISDTFVVSKVDFPTIAEKNIFLDIGAAAFTVTDKNQSDHLTLNANYFENYGKPELMAKQDDDKLDIELKQDHRNGFRSTTKEPEYNIELGEVDTPASLSIDMGAGVGEINLTELDLKNVTANIGAGELKMSIGQGSKITEKFNVDLGAGAFTLNLPNNFAYRLNYHVGAGGLKIDGQDFGGIGKDGIIQSDNYDAANIKIEIEVDVGAGQFTLNR